MQLGIFYTYEHFPPITGGSLYKEPEGSFFLKGGEFDDRSYCRWPNS